MWVISLLSLSKLMNILIIAILTGLIIVLLYYLLSIVFKNKKLKKQIKDVDHLILQNRRMIKKNDNEQ